MEGAIVFTSQDADLRNVNCPWCFNIDQLYSFIYSFTNEVFNNDQILKIIKRIDSINSDSYLNRQKHIDYVNYIKNRRGY